MLYSTSLSEYLLPSYLCIVVTWGLILVAVNGGIWWMMRLTSRSAKFQGPVFPLVSILVPARNEAANIGPCLESLLRQTYPNFEILVIDDRSNDNTSEIVESFAQRDKRVRLYKVEQLAEGWTGKTHALYTGARLVSGEFLLFVDADTKHHPDNLSIILSYAQSEAADLVSLVPAMTSVSFWERVVHPFACIVSGFFNDPLQSNYKSCSGSAFGNGQYMFFRRSAYDRIGGHESVRTEFVEDMQLARRVKRSGLNLRVAVAPELTQTRMFGSLHAVYEGWSRIIYGSVDRDPVRLALLTIGLFVIIFSAFVAWPLSILSDLIAPHSPQSQRWLGLSSLHVLMIAGTLAPLYRLTHNQRRYLWLFPAAYAIVMAILVRAIWICITHRVTWRGTRYNVGLHQSITPNRDTMASSSATGIG